MSFSDILAIVEIFVTILFGYYITHWVGVRDTRTRSVKELYLNQLAKIKGEVDAFFKDLFDGKLNGRKIADWYGHQQGNLTCFDEGLRMALPIRKRKIEDIVNDIHEEITGSEFYNDNYKKQRYVLNGSERVRMTALKNKVDKAFNEYVVQINNSRQYYSWEILKQNYHFDVEYFKDEEKKHPVLEALKIRGLKMIPYFLVLFALFFIVRATHNSYKQSIEAEEQRKELDESTYNRLFEKVDSLNESMKEIVKGHERSTVNDSCLINIISRDLELEKSILRTVSREQN